MRPERLVGLDALRGIAAVMVAIHHVAAIYFDYSPIEAGRAVDLFFVISGFVMSRTYERRLADGVLTTPAFIAARYRRLFLPMAIGAMIGATWLTARDGDPWSELAAFAVILLFLPAVWRTTAFAANVVTWSLFIEIFCNALHGALFARLSSKRLFECLFVAAVVFIAWSVLGVSQWGVGTLDIVMTIPRELACYLGGILLFRTLPSWPRIPAWCGLPAFVGACFYHGAAYDVAFVVVAPLIVRSALDFPQWRWASGVGAISFPLYAVHVPVLDACKWAGWPAGAAIGTVAALVALLLVITADRPGLEGGLKPSSR